MDQHYLSVNFGGNHHLNVTTQIVNTGNVTILKYKINYYIYFNY